MTDLERRVLEAIDRRGITPRPYAYFLAKRSVFWTLAALSVLLGALSVAVAIYGVSDFIATGGYYFDEMPFDDIFEILPFVWLGFLALFVASAFIGLRHTRRNYRYSRTTVILATVGVTVLLGALLDVFDVGRSAHEWLMRSAPFYERLVFGRDDIWRDPDKGYLGGRILTVNDGASLTLLDFFGQQWTVDISAAAITLEEPIEDEEDIAIRGERTGPATFRAATIEEWD